jgi:signal transduction histidine kinase
LGGSAAGPNYEVAIIEDIGDRKRAEDALRAANENLREADRGGRRALMQGRHVELAVDVPGAPVIVDGDETRLAQILGNTASGSRS